MIITLDNKRYRKSKWQSRDTGNIELTRRIAKTNKTKTQHRNLKIMSNTNPTKKTGGEQRCSRRKYLIIQIMELLP